jgi:hypothetical protein
MNSTSGTALRRNDRLAPLRVNGARLWQSLMELAQIGATP